MGSGTALVAGVDSSTQSTKVLVCEAATGTVVREGRAAHPEGTEVDPAAWWSALQEATAGGLLDGVSAIAIGGQQHGMVTLDEAGRVVRPALLWNDTRSAGAAHDLVTELGGAQAWADAVGSVPLASFTVSKVRWLAEHEPEHAARAASVVLPHDWITGRLLSREPEVVTTLVTDRGDASGTGYWSPATGEYRLDLLERAFGRRIGTPSVLAPWDAAGETPDGLLVGPGTGDNMGAALGLGIRPGDVVVSLGTSGTAFAAHGRPTADASGFVAGFADATGQYLPLVCTLNAARVLTAAAQLLDTDLAGLERLATAAEPGAGGLVLLPYLDGERTPDLPEATGTLGGVTRANATPENLARAAVEGMLCGLADGIDALVAQGIAVERVLLIGGAARSSVVQQAASVIFGVPVVVPSPAEYVALGAARQAATVLARREGADLPDWDVLRTTELEPGEQGPGKRVRDAYRALRRTVHPSTS
ncbi:MAG TPA: xylulokinase [Segeticoccus sp.]|uniref:xylulokinase n=1 Tax=Segeticoccus sp. TaxID=2706531 RepID=UPI002D7E634D|nr:xylulokinase [Segeticoccus sp.]HET8601396.1 xylulokinase [Segeticoccus sp.]